MTDRLYRSRDERMFAGVAGGVAERYDLDPSLVRVVWIILMFLTGSLFFWLYVVMAIVVPEAPSGTDRWAGWTTATEPGPGAVPGWGAPAAAGSSAFASTEPPSGSAGPSDAGPAGDAGPTADVAATGAAGSIPDVAAPGAPPPGAAPLAGTPPPPPSSGWDEPAGWSSAERDHRHRRGGGSVIGGLILVLLGGFFLIRTVAPDLELGPFWPVVLIVIGIALLFGSIRPGRSDDS